MEGTVKNVTVSFSGNQWFASIQTEREVEQPLPQASSIVGIDMGITRFATLSDGVVLEPRNSFKTHQTKLARYQRAMSHKKKFSKNWMKAKAKVQKLHTRIAHLRQDYQHQASSVISKNHAIFCLEDMQVSNMSKSAAGTVDKPGSRVRQKAGLNCSILDQGWGEFRRQLTYNLAWNGGEVIAVAPQYTSQECLRCHHIASGNRRKQAVFKCLECHFTEHADLVTAINIKHKGLSILEGQDTVDDSTRQRFSAAQLVCGDPVLSGRSVKQEPAEGSALH